MGNGSVEVQQFTCGGVVGDDYPTLLRTCVAALQRTIREVTNLCLELVERLVTDDELVHAVAQLALFGAQLATLPDAHAVARSDKGANWRDPRQRGPGVVEAAGGPYKHAEDQTPDHGSGSGHSRDVRPPLPQYLDALHS